MILRPFRGGGIIESSLSIAGREVSRGGSIACQGSVIDLSSKRIARCVRSTLAAEPVASANLVELLLRHQSFLNEVLFQYTFDSRPSEEDPLILCSPPNPWVDILRNDESDSTNVLGDSWPVDFDSWNADGTCLLISDASPTTLSAGDIYLGSLGSLDLVPHPDQKKTRIRRPIQIIALADAANVYSSVINTQPRSIGKLTKIALAFLRDVAATVRYSFLDAKFNISDTGAKENGNRHLFLQVRARREFVISFVGRRELKRVGERLGRIWKSGYRPK